jgi:hypothetical protein
MGAAGEGEAGEPSWTVAGDVLFATKSNMASNRISHIVPENVSP